MKKIILLAFILLTIISKLFSQPEWKVITGSKYPLYDVCFIDSNIGFAVGGIGGGIDEIIIYPIISSGDTCARIIKTTNGGNNWSLKNAPVNVRLNSVHFINENFGYCVGANAAVIKTTNGGELWQRIYLSDSTTFNKVYVIDSSKQIIIGNMGRIYLTENSGESWGIINSSTRENLLSIFFVNENNGFITGENGIILKTTNCGRDWFKLNSSTNLNLTSIFFIDENIGYICGGKFNLEDKKSIILKTTNGGINWNIITERDYTIFKSIYMFDENSGYACGVDIDFDEPYVYFIPIIIYTNNGFINFDECKIIRNYDAIGEIYSLYFVSPKKGFASSDKSILKLIIK